MRTPHLALDLGCGPGWSTRLIQDVLSPDRTVGLDASEHYVGEARKNHGSDLEFKVHDVVLAPFPVPAPDVMFCRFLLTHLRSLKEALRTWASIAAPGALLFVHETESLETNNPKLRRYYDLVAQLQDHYGQALLVGTVLEASFENSGWELVKSKRRVLEKPASEMASLHVANLRTWRHDEYAMRTFEADELDALEASLERISSRREDGDVVVNAARQIIARRI
jgi:ubiquinone/menaquinone biosynthesis C-methylase UbiE